MNLSLTPEVEQFIQVQLESGKYATAEEVVLAGIKLLEKRERIYKERYDELKREITIGIEASERGEVIDGEEFFQKMRLHLQQRRTQSGCGATSIGLLLLQAEILKVSLII